MTKATRFLTDQFIKKSTPQAKEYKIGDGQNLHLLVKPNGSKLWLFIYTHPTTKARKKINIGQYPYISLAKAREQRNSFHTLLTEGIDPTEHKAQSHQEAMRQAETLFNFAETQWKPKKAKEVKKRTLDDEYARLKLHLFPLFGHYRLADITLLEAVEKLRPLSITRNSTCSKVVIYFCEIMEYAVICGLLPHNPLYSLSKAFYKVQATHQPTIQPSELPEFLSRLQNSRIMPTTKLLIQWQLLTMVRPAEAVSAEWSEIDFDNALWAIPPEKMKGKKDKPRQHIVPLSSQALAILHEMRLFNGDKKHVFTSQRKPSQPCNSEAANRAITVNIDKGYYKGRLTSHGMRSIASTYLNDCGYNKDLIEACLAHISGDSVRNAYNKSTYLTLRRELMQKWGDYVAECKAHG
ncbi:tyrosine-type recombinase/integrase [Testudinibacter aquarius]|uniref:DUF4102 domain-containing protein n=1 Tax=Testudinibacter aquarius TaxID=1524974 RepID=A0A4R3YBV1_9PAST|nr:integrase arm-type DNA-binding domain-containing protein [Testudinibacter aquarius]KAE9530320.1 hypothetical protein A1D24_06460 [Testudinibacter aquarius]TCV87863.1 integrase [Testudinibacter aquarius]TNG89015.1 DUF4102 domain-containing protein [Testudinibacter aquarius]